MESRAGTSGSGRNEKTVRDRRVERTRAGVFAALRDLMFERGYGPISVLDITERASVGRSTFYEHFASKDDVLRESLPAVLTPLAEAVGPHCSLPAIELVLRHFREQTVVVRAFLREPARAVLVESLAALVEERLRDVSPGARSPVLPAGLAARSVAEAQLGLIAAWLERDEDSCPASALARALQAASRAVAGALRSDR